MSEEKRDPVQWVKLTTNDTVTKLAATDIANMNWGDCLTGTSLGKRSEFQLQHLSDYIQKMGRLKSKIVSIDTMKERQKTALYYMEEFKLQLAYLRGRLENLRLEAEDATKFLKEVGAEKSFLVKHNLWLREPKSCLTTLNVIIESNKSLFYSFEEKKLRVYTPVVILYDIDLGSFCIEIDLKAMAENVRKSLTNQDVSPSDFLLALHDNPVHPEGKDASDDDKKYYHPHVEPNGNICYGNMELPIKIAAHTLELAAVVEHVKTLLTNYNKDSPFVHLTAWPSSEAPDLFNDEDDDEEEEEEEEHCRCCEQYRTGVREHNCGHLSCEDCSYHCDGCDTSVCGNCQRCCEQRNCDRSLCPDCSKHCDECNNYFCERHISYRECCGQDLCEGCLCDCDIADDLDSDIDDDPDVVEELKESFLQFAAIPYTPTEPSDQEEEETDESDVAITAEEHVDDVPATAATSQGDPVVV